MRVDVLLFASLADEVGTGRMELDLPAGSTVEAALDRLGADHEPIAAGRARLAVAVNDRYCEPDAVLREGDALALIPPVSGG